MKHEWLHAWLNVDFELTFRSIKYTLTKILHFNIATFHYIVKFFGFEMRLTASTNAFRRSSAVT